MTEREVQVHASDGVLRLLIDRPESRNALNIAAFDILAGALREGDRDPGVRCIVLGTANEHFSAGWDLNDESEPPDDEPHGYAALMLALEGCRKPIVAAVRGYAIGIGLTMLGHCDIVLIGESARLRAPFASLGLCPEAGSSWTFPALIGPQATAELFYTGRWLGAAEAVQRGIGTRLIPDADLLDEAMALAKEIAAQPLDSLLVTKFLLSAHRSQRAGAARHVEDLHFAQLMESEAHRNAVAAFTSKGKST